LALTAASLHAESVVAGTAGSPYSPIVARNVFGLKKWLRTAALFCLQLFRLVAYLQTQALSSVHPQKSFSGATM
jgi:hypothetical protein